MSCVLRTQDERFARRTQETVGMIYAFGALASIVGVLIYHKFLKDYSFRNILFFAQFLYVFSGMVDLTFILRWNLKLGIPDYIFVVTEECLSRIVVRIRMMPILVLSTKLCPLGIEGTFFALLMCIDSLGSLSSKWGGGLVLRALHITRTDFKNLWLAVFIKVLLRIATFGFIFLIPRADQSDVLVAPNFLMHDSLEEEESLQLVSMNGKNEESGKKSDTVL